MIFRKLVSFSAFVSFVVDGFCRRFVASEIVFVACNLLARLAPAFDTLFLTA